MKWKWAPIVACAAAMIAAEPHSPTPPRPAPPIPAGQEQLPQSLLVQAAMKQARESLKYGEYGTAVRVLEGQLSKANGDAVYLTLLEDAYRAYIKDLQEKGRYTDAQKYLQRLAILDPAVSVSPSVRYDSSTATTTSPAHQMPAAKAAAVRGGDFRVRANSDDEQAPQKPKSSADADALKLAEREFQARHYVEAAKYYDQASRSETRLSEADRERWAYCKLHAVTEKINHATANPDWTALERDVRSALELAPRLKYGQEVLRTIQTRSKETKKEEPRPSGSTKQAPSSAADPISSQCPVQHHAKRQNGWQVSESAHFRVFHDQPALAEQVLQVAERTRAAVHRKWFADLSAGAWSAKCDIFLHAHGDAYCQATGVSPDSPGHSSIEAEREDASRVHGRRMDLRLDDANMLRAVLPHETTHVVLAGQFGTQPLPRWADEGMAILSEPYDRVSRHFQGLPKAQQEGRVFGAQQLIHLDDYPSPRYMASFYGQSASLVQYLTELRGPQVFAQFLRDGQRQGYEAALRRHYQLSGFADLDQRWSPQMAVSPTPKPPETASTDPY